MGAALLALKGSGDLARTPECPGANRPDGPQGPIRSRSPPRSRVGRDAAGIAWGWTASAAPPRTPYIWLRISIARPFGSASSAKTIDGWLPAARSDAVLNEKYRPPQRQKIVRRADLIEASAATLTPLSRFLSLAFLQQRLAHQLELLKRPLVDLGEFE